MESTNKFYYAIIIAVLCCSTAIGFASTANGSGSSPSSSSATPNAIAEEEEQADSSATQNAIAEEEKEQADDLMADLAEEKSEEAAKKDEDMEVEVAGEIGMGAAQPAGVVLGPLYKEWRAARAAKKAAAANQANDPEEDGEQTGAWVCDGCDEQEALSTQDMNSKIRESDGENSSVDVSQNAKDILDEQNVSESDLNEATITIGSEVWKYDPEATPTDSVIEALENAANAAGAGAPDLSKGGVTGTTGADGGGSSSADDSDADDGDADELGELFF